MVKSQDEINHRLKVLDKKHSQMTTYDDEIRHIATMLMDKCINHCSPENRMVCMEALIKSFDIELDEAIDMMLNVEKLRGEKKSWSFQVQKH